MQNRIVFLSLFLFVSVSLSYGAADRVFPNGLVASPRGILFVTDYRQLGCTNWREVMTGVPNPIVGGELDGMKWIACNIREIEAEVVFEPGDVVQNVEAYGFRFRLRGGAVANGHSLVFRGGHFVYCTFDLSGTDYLFDGISCNRCLDTYHRALSGVASQAVAFRDSH